MNLRKMPVAVCSLVLCVSLSALTNSVPARGQAINLHADQLNLSANQNRDELNGIVDESTETIRKYADLFAAQQSVQFAEELAKSYDRRGKAYAHLGKPEAAIDDFNQAIQLYSRLIERGGGLKFALDLMATLVNRVDALHDLGREGSDDLLILTRGDFNEVLWRPHLAEFDGHVVIVQPQGEFAKIDVTASNEMVRKLTSPVFQVRETAIRTVAADLEEYAPPVLFFTAAALVDLGRDNEAIFLYSLGLLRTSSDAYKSSDTSTHQAVHSLIEQVGSPFLEFFHTDPQAAGVLMKKAIQWDRVHKRTYDPRWIALHGLSAMSDTNISFAPQSEWAEINENTRLEFEESMRAVILEATAPNKTQGGN